MYVVFTNPSGWPDRMKVRDQKQLEDRLAKLASEGYYVTVLSVHSSVGDTWDAMIEAQKRFREIRYGIESCCA